MSLFTRLAGRFLLSKTSDGFISFISGVSMVGVALGVFSLVVVTSVISGFEGEIARAVTGVNGDVILTTRGEPIKESEVYEKKIKTLLGNVKGISPSLMTELMVSGPNAVAGGVIEGIDPNRVGEATEIPKRVKEGRLPVRAHEFALGAALAEKIGAKLGSDIRLIIPFKANDKSDSFTPTAVSGVVVGLVEIGMYEYDSKFLFGEIEGVREALDLKGSVTTFKIRLEPDADSLAAARRLNDGFGYPFRSKSWAQLNKNLFYAIKLEKAVIAIILTAIVVVAAFNVLSTLMMMIEDKTREIAILKAMGFRPGQGFRLFMFLGLAIGFVGVCVGIFFGIGANVFIDRSRLISLPSDIYYIGFLPVVMRAPELIAIASGALVITFLSTLFPAIQIARRPPLQGIREDS